MSRTNTKNTKIFAYFSYSTGLAPLLRSTLGGDVCTPLAVTPEERYAMGVGRIEQLAWHSYAIQHPDEVALDYNKPLPRSTAVLFLSRHVNSQGLHFRRKSLKRTHQLMMCQSICRPSAKRTGWVGGAPLFSCRRSLSHG